MKNQIIELLKNYSISLGNEILLMREKVLLNDADLNKIERRTIEIENELFKIENSIDYLNLFDEI